MMWNRLSCIFVLVVFAILFAFAQQGASATNTTANTTARNASSSLRAPSGNRIATAANPMQSAVAMGGGALATLLFRDPLPPLTVSRALAIAAMARACRDRERVELPTDEPLLFPQQSLWPTLTFNTDSDHVYNGWRQHYRGAVVAGMFVIPFGAACASLLVALCYQSYQHYQRGRKPAPPPEKKKKDHDPHSSGFKINKATGDAGGAPAAADDEDAELEQMLLDIESFSATNNNNSNTANDGDEGGEDGRKKKANKKRNKFVDDVWQTARVPTVIAICLAIALENVACSCVLILSLDSGGLSYNQALDRGLGAAALVVFCGLMGAAAAKTNEAVAQCDCVDAEVVRGDPPQPWKTGWSEAVFGTRCWGLSRETELNRASDTPASKILKGHLRFVGPFHGRNVMRPTEAHLRYSCTPWTFLVEMVFTAVLGFGRGFLMSDKVKCVSAGIWTMVLIAAGVLWNWALRPRLSPLMMVVDFVTFLILLVAAITWIVSWRFSDDVAGFGAIVIAAGTLLCGGARYVAVKCYGIRSVPLVRADDIDIELDEDMQALFAGSGGNAKNALNADFKDVFLHNMEGALLTGAQEAALLADDGTGNALTSFVDNLEFQNLDDPAFDDLFLQCRELVADGAAKNAKELRDVRAKMRDRAAELAALSRDMKQQLALQHMQRRAEMIAGGRDPETGKTFAELCDPDRPFAFTDDPHCRKLMEEYKAVVNKPGALDAKAQKRLDELALDIERRQETLMRMTEEQRRKMTADEAARNASRFRQYLDADPFERGFVCSDDPEFRGFQQEARELLRHGPKRNGDRILQLHDLMQSRAQDLRAMLPINRQMLADQARAERARQIASRIDPDTGKSFAELTSTTRPFEYTDDAVFKVLHEEHKCLSENPMLNRARMDALVRQMQLRGKELDALTPAEKAALVAQTAARNAARLNQLFDWGGDPLGPKDVFLLSDDDAEYGKYLAQCRAMLAADPAGNATDVEMAQMEMRLRQEELGKTLTAEQRTALIDRRRQQRLEMLMNGIDPFSGKHFSELVDDKRAFQLVDDAQYKALYDEFDFLSRDSPTAHEHRLSELQRLMAARGQALQRLSDRDRADMVREAAMREGERIRRMMMSVAGPTAGSGNGRRGGGGQLEQQNAAKFVLSDDPEYNAMQRQLVELLASGRKGTSAEQEQAAAMDRLAKRAAQLALMSEREKRAMAMLRQQNHLRMHEQHGRDPFTAYSYSQLADRSRGFCHWDDASFDAMARELKLLLDRDPAKNAARIAELSRRMQRRGAAMQGYSAAEKQARTQRTAGAFQDMLQRMLDGADPLGPGHFVASTDDLVMRKAGEETHDLARRRDLHAAGTAWHGDLLAALDTQRQRFAVANERLSAAEKSALVRARREEAARFAAAGRDMRSGMTYEELTDATRAFQLTDDSIYEQLFEEMQHLVGDNAPRNAARVQELEKQMQLRARDLEAKLDDAARRRLVEARALRNAQQFSRLPALADPLGAPHFCYTDDPAYKRIHDDLQALLRRPTAGNFNEKLAALKKALLARAGELATLDRTARLRLADVRRNEMLRMRKRGVDPLTGKTYEELCSPKRAFQYTDDPEYRRTLESYLFFAGSNPDQHERRLADLVAALRRRQAVVEAWDDATKQRAMALEVQRIKESQRRALNYGLEWTPPDAGIAIHLDDEPEPLDIEADLAAMIAPAPKEEPPPPPPPKNTDYQLDDGGDDPYALDDDDDDGSPNGGGEGGGIGAARNEELMRRMRELKANLDEKNAAAALAAARSSVYSADTGTTAFDDDD